MTKRKNRDKKIRVTVEDLETGETRSVEIMNEYVVVCAGTCYIALQQAYGNGTVQLTIKGRGSQDMRAVAVA